MLLGEAYNLLCSSNTLCQYQQVSVMYTFLPTQLLQKPLHQLTLSPQNTGHYKPDCQDVRKQSLWSAVLGILGSSKDTATIFISPSSPFAVNAHVCDSDQSKLLPKLLIDVELSQPLTPHAINTGFILQSVQKTENPVGWKGFQGASNSNPKRLSDLHKVTVSGERQVMNSSCSSHPLYQEKWFILLLLQIP